MTTSWRRRRKKKTKTIKENTIFFSGADATANGDVQVAGDVQVNGELRKFRLPLDYNLK